MFEKKIFKYPATARFVDPDLRFVTVSKVKLKKKGNLDGKNR